MSLRSLGLNVLCLVCLAGAVYLVVLGLGFWAFLTAALGAAFYLASKVAP